MMPNKSRARNTPEHSPRSSGADYTFVGLPFCEVSIAWSGPSPVEHKELRWNAQTQEWFCVLCGRTSDHTAEEDARVELKYYECILPAPD
jgi:hypothetical protein